MGQVVVVDTGMDGGIDGGEVVVDTGVGGGIDGGEVVVDTGVGGGRAGGSDSAGGSHGRGVPVWTREVE